MRVALAAALLVFAVALVPIATSDATSIPTPWWVGALVALLLILGLRRSGPPLPLRDAPLAAALGLAAAAAHLRPGAVVGHDGLNHLWGAWAYLQAWHAGDPLPIWLHHLGLGQPMPLFYGPLSFWAMAPFALAGGGPSAMFSGSLALASVCAALTAWWSVARWTNDRRAALVAAAALAFAPYRLLDANYRTAIGETWALSLMPLAFYGFDRLLAAPTRRSFALAAVPVALVVLAHPLSLWPLIVSVAALLAARIVFARGGSSAGVVSSGRAAAAAALAGATGLALAGFFSVPLAAEYRYLDQAPAIVQSDASDYYLQGLAPLELLERQLWFRLLYPHPENETRFAEMPIYFGCILLAGLAAAALAAPHLGAGASPARALALVGLTCLALALAPVARAASLLPGMAVLQYPWRFLGPASVAAALVLGFLSALGPTARRRLPAYALAAALALVVFVDGFPYTGAAAHLRPWRGLLLATFWGSGENVGLEIPRPWPLRVAVLIYPPNSCCVDVGVGHQIYPEYVTSPVRDLSSRLSRASVGLQGLLGAKAPLLRIDAQPYARLYRRNSRRLSGLEFRRGGGRIEVALSDRRGGRVEVAEQYFPGWQVEIDGGWREVVPSADGLLSVEVPERQEVVRFRFDRWRWDRSLGWALTLATSCLLLWLARPTARPRSA